MDRFSNFETSELQTIYLGLFRLRDSAWISNAETFERLRQEIAAELQVQYAGRGGAWSLADEVLVAA